MAIYLLSFVETPRKFIIAELSIRKLGSSSVLIIFTMQTYKKLIKMAIPEQINAKSLKSLFAAFISNLVLNRGDKNLKQVK